MCSSGRPLYCSLKAAATATTTTKTGYNRTTTTMWWLSINTRQKLVCLCVCMNGFYIDRSEADDLAPLWPLFKRSMPKTISHTTFFVLLLRCFFNFRGKFNYKRGLPSYTLDSSTLLCSTFGQCMDCIFRKHFQLDCTHFRGFLFYFYNFYRNSSISDKGKSEKD